MKHLTLHTILARMLVGVSAAAVIFISLPTAQIHRGDHHAVFAGHADNQIADGSESNGGKGGKGGAKRNGIA